jgi:hypothetical protein
MGLVWLKSGMHETIRSVSLRARSTAGHGHSTGRAGKLTGPVVETAAAEHCVFNVVGVRAEACHARDGVSPVRAAQASSVTAGGPPAHGLPYTISTTAAAARRK